MSEKPIPDSSVEPDINNDVQDLNNSLNTQQLEEFQQPVKLKTQKPATFQSNYANASFPNKMFYIYGGKLVSAVNTNKGIMTQHMLEKMNKNSEYDSKRLKEFNERHE